MQKIFTIEFANFARRKQKEETKNEKEKSWDIDLLIYQEVYRSSLYSFRLLCISTQV